MGWEKKITGSGKRFLIYCAVIILTTGLLGVLFLRRDTISTEYLDFDEHSMLHVHHGMEVEQVIRPTEGFLVSISLFCANIEPDMGILEMAIRNEDGKLIHQAKIDTDTLETGAFNRFVIKKTVKKNEEYTLSLTFRAEDEENEELYFGLMAVLKEKNLPQTGDCRFEGLEEDEYNLAVGYEMSRPPGIGLTLFGAAVVMINLFLIPEIGKMEILQKQKERILRSRLFRRSGSGEQGMIVANTQTEEENDEKNQHNDSLLQ